MLLQVQFQSNLSLDCLLQEKATHQALSFEANEGNHLQSEIKP